MTGPELICWRRTRWIVVVGRGCSAQLLTRADGRPFITLDTHEAHDLAWRHSGRAVDAEDYVQTFEQEATQCRTNS